MAFLFFLQFEAQPVGFCAWSERRGLSLQAATLSQPVAPVRPVTDTYFGTPVVDPYRWMENLKSPEVQSWMKGAERLHPRLPEPSARPGRADQAGRVARQRRDARGRVWSFAVRRYFYFKLTPEDQTPKLYARDGLEGRGAACWPIRRCSAATEASASRSAIFIRRRTASWSRWKSRRAVRRKAC